MQPLLNATRATIPMVASLIAVILSGCPVASTLGENHIVAESIATWDFGASEDKRKDGWPDGWQRTTGQNYPKFIPVGIAQDATTAEQLQEIEDTKRVLSQWWLAYEQSKFPWEIIPESTPSAVDQWLERTIANPYLRIRMDGGSAEVVSPMIPVDNNSVYYATALAKSNTSDFSARIKLRFLDGSGKTLLEANAKPISKKSEWQSIASNSLYEPHPSTKFVQVVLCVSPNTSRAYKGEVGFDSVRVQRTPRLTLYVDKPGQMYRSGEKVLVRCSATGMNTEQTSLTLKLVDHTGHELFSVTKEVVRDEDTKRFVSKSTPAANPKKAYWDGYCEWAIPNLEPGYYEISTHLSRGATGSIELLEHFAVLPTDGYSKSDPRFGWTIHETDGSPPTTNRTMRLIESMREARVGKVKIPVWFDFSSSSSAREYTDRVDRIQATGIQCIGVLASPSQSLRERFPRLESAETGAVMEDSVLLSTFLEPVLRQMCMRLVEFQIGWDHETDFVANPRFSKSLEAIRRLIHRYGQETQLVASHNIQLQEQDVVGISRWQLHSETEMTDEEVTRWMSTTKKDKMMRPWLSITPLDSDRYSLDVRVQDMLARMLSIAADTSPSNTAWIRDPFSSQVGLLNASGGPREMFVPFRSIAGALAGMQNIGSIPVPSLGNNRLLVSADQARIIAWSPQPTIAQLFLGNQVQARDVWGRPVEVVNTDTDSGKVQRIEIGKWPVIIDGVDPRAAQWRMGASIVDRRIDPLRGGNQEIKVRFHNPLSSAATGSVTLVAPSIILEPSSASIDVEPSTDQVISIPFTLVPDASSSISNVRLDFKMGGDNPVRFSIDEELQVGSDDIEFSMECQIEQDQLLVTVEAINFLEEPVSFDCMLLVPGRPRGRTQFANLKERTSQSFSFSNGAELVGETLWLRCEQFGTRRVLNLQKKVLPPDQSLKSSNNE